MAQTAAFISSELKKRPEAHALKQRRVFHKYYPKQIRVLKTWHLFASSTFCVLVYGQVEHTPNMHSTCVRYGCMSVFSFASPPCTVRPSLQLA